MAHSGNKNLSAVLLFLLVAIDAAAGGRIHAESASVKVFFPCNGHLSGDYKGPCFGLINDRGCNRTCLDESTGNVSGECNFFQCWCQTPCNSETVAAAAADATAPIPA
ncbi:unnamed protein product [Urochloa decumbens]|uniref:Knottins-like domain-containing protein n=1 Tax=Urochloa decumbens TaxID=240449 RepID=A0ABC9AM19_9POAL